MREVALEAVTVRVCREVGGRVITNCLNRDLNIETDLSVSQRLDIVNNTIPLYDGSQIAVDTFSSKPSREPAHVTELRRHGQNRGTRGHAQNFLKIQGKMAGRC